MIAWAKLTGDELALLDRELPVIVPVGLVEAHGPHLTLGLDIDTAEHFARTACEATGAILMPTIAYGFADAMREYPGTVGVRPETLAAMVYDLCDSLCLHGFHKVIFLNGHGANNTGIELGIHRIWERHPQLKPASWTWWGIVGLSVHHADKAETEFAMLCGSPVYMERARDFTFTKPWHMVRSRHACQPESGGINGYPSQARPEDSQANYTKVLQTLISRINQAKDDRGGE